MQPTPTAPQKGLFEMTEEEKQKLLEEQKKQQQQKQDPKPDEQSQLELAKALKEARENSVPKSEYEKLQKTNQELIAQIIDGSDAGGGQHRTPKTKADVQALRNELYGPKCSELSNLEFWDKTLKLREAVIEVDGIDPFLPHGANIKPTEQDVESAENVAKVVSQCIKEADGDSGVFTALLQSKTNNDSQAFVAHLKKVGAIK